MSDIIPESDITDESLATKFQSDNEDHGWIFEILMEKHYPGIYHLVKKFFYNFDEAEANQTTLDIFVYIYQIRRNYCPSEGIFKSWIYGIAMNRCRNILKTQLKYAKRHQPFEEEDPSQLSKNIFPTPSQYTQQNQLSEKLSNCIAKLRETQRAVVILRLEELKFREIAEHLQSPETTVKTRWQTARDKLKICLEKHGIYAVGDY